MYVNFNILNQLGSPSLNSNTFANRPAAGQTGRLFISTDTFEIYRDNGTGWDLIGTGTGGGITGSGTANQVTYWTGTSAVGGESAFTYNPTTNALRVDGNISLNRNADAWTPNNVFTVGNGSFTSDVGGTYLTFNAYYNVDWKYSQNGVASFYAQANGGHIWYNASSGTAGNNLNSVIAMYLDDKENLGVATAPPNWYTDYNATIINTANVYGQKSTTVGGITSNAFIDNTALSWRYQITGLAARMEIASGAVNWFTAPSGTLNTDITFTRRLRLTNTGQMNFNTADTLWGSGARVIHLSDRMSMYSITSGTAAAIYSNNAYFDGTQTRRIIGSTAGQFVSDSDTFYWENAAASTADSLISWTRIATMTTSANVLIGTTTDAGFKLQVNGDSQINGLRIGKGPGSSNSANTILGLSAGSSITTSSSSTCIGAESGLNLSTGNNCLFIGHRAGRANTTGENLLFIGNDAGFVHTTGYQSVIIGHAAGRANTTGYQQCIIGHGAGQFNTTGFQNTFIGMVSGQNNTTGSQNVTIGSNSGTLTNAGANLTSLSTSILIGYDTRVNAVAESNQIVIANSGRGLGSNTTVIGNSSTTFGRFWGNLLLGTSTNNGQALQVNGAVRIDGQTAATAGGASGQHLIINCDGTTYKIALLNN